jgi:hypothetical protein
MTPKDLENYKKAWRRHNKDCRRRYLHSFQFKTVEDYIKYVKGAKYVPPADPIPETKAQPKPEIKKTIPSHVSNSTGALARKEPKVYSGERKLVGIATMHKSNMVPVFEDENGDAKKEATELAHMRR